MHLRGVTRLTASNAMANVKIYCYIVIIKDLFLVYIQKNRTQSSYTAKRRMYEYLLLD